MNCACRGEGPVCTDDCERGDRESELAALGLGPEVEIKLKPFKLEVDTEMLETRLAIARDLLRPFLVVPGIAGS